MINLFGYREAKLLLKGKKVDAPTQRLLDAFNINTGLTPRKSKKIAVCISGDLRTFPYCKDKLLRFFQGHQVTFFCHCWDDADAGKLKSLNNVFIKKEVRPDFKKLERASIKAFGFKEYKNGLKIPLMSLNLFPMWYGVNQAFRLIEEEGFCLNDYDLICRSRYDNYFLGQLEQYDKPLLNNEILIDENYDGYGGIGDQFAIGKPDVMSTYCTLLEWLSSQVQRPLKQPKPNYFAEVVLKDYLDEKGVEVTGINFGLRLMREHFVGLSDDEIPLRSHQFSSTRNQAAGAYVREYHSDLFSSL